MRGRLGLWEAGRVAIFAQEALVLLAAVAAFWSRGETPLGVLVVAAVSEPPGCPDDPIRPCLGRCSS